MDAGISFDELNRKTEKEMAESLQAIDDRLYGVEITEAMALATDPEEEEDPYRRYGTNQYHAHVDGVTDKELIQWQSIAPFLRVEGTSIHHLCPSYEDLFSIKAAEKNNDGIESVLNEEGFVYADSRIHGHGSLCVDWTAYKDSVIFTPSTYTYLNPTPPTCIKPTSASHTHNSTTSTDMDFDEEGQFSLHLIGKACTFFARDPSVQEEEDGDVDIDEVHGILEETIEVHCDPAEKTSSYYKDPDEWPPSGPPSTGTDGALPWTGTFPVSPLAVQQEECVAILTEGIWSDVVDALRPMIETVVRASHEHNLIYDDDASLSNLKVSANQEGETEGEENVQVMSFNQQEEQESGGYEAVTIVERKNSFDDWDD